jgi:hypothetical protein
MGFPDPVGSIGVSLLQELRESTEINAQAIARLMMTLS